MTHTEQLTRYICHFVDELITSGVQHAVISPGSRSTPLALALTEHEQVEDWVLVDERSAAFFALGLAKASRKPAVLVCTSGTATANYYPAIIEAYYSRVPLIVLTADRPHELRDVDAPQAIEQINMYGNYAKWFHEMALPDDTPDMLAYARSKAARAVHIACAEAGPVHLNFPLREPLNLDFSLTNIWREAAGGGESYYPVEIGTPMLSPEQLDHLCETFGKEKKGLLVAGPGLDFETARYVLQLANTWGIPLLVDPLSQLRTNGTGDVIETYDAILRTATMREKLQPDFIVRFGAMPVSKMYRFYLEAHPTVKQFIVTENSNLREPTGNRTTFIQAAPAKFAEQFYPYAAYLQGDSNWLQTWQDLNTEAKRILTEVTEPLTEGSVVLPIIKEIPRGSALFSGNSMAIRDLDSFLMQTDKQVTVLGNRGANGIDGVVSTACGTAAAGQPTTLLIGDLSFYHDMNGLFAAKHYQLPLTIVLVNNSGGGIFSFLPQAKDKKHFEAIFGTPLHLDFQHAAALYGAAYTLASDTEAFQKALQAAYQNQGLTIIELQTDRDENAAWHRDTWEKVNETLLEIME